MIEIADLLKSDRSMVTRKVIQILEQQKKLDKQISTFQKQLAGNQSDDLLKDAIEINGINLLSSRVENVEVKDLRDIVDKIKDKLKNAIIVLAIVKNDKISLVSGVSKGLTDTYHAGDILKHVALQVDGKGGGRADMAQGGGSDISNLQDALNSVKELIK